MKICQLLKFKHYCDIYYRIDDPNLDFFADPLKVMTPYYTYFVLLPYGMAIKEKIIKPKKEYIVENIELEIIPVPEGYPELSDSERLNENELYPSLLYQDSGYQNKNGFGLFILSVFPYRYLKSKKQIHAIEEIELEIILKKSKRIEDICKKKIIHDQNLLNYLTSKAINPEVIQSYKGK